MDSLIIGNNKVVAFELPKHITIDGVTKIGAFAFSKRKSLTSVTIGNSVTSIQDYAFAECRNLTSITIPEGVAYIGAEAFVGCWNLTEINIPDSVTHIGNYAFHYCSGLTSIRLPKKFQSPAELRRIGLWYPHGLFTTGLIPNNA